jgi:hypothetical protein
MDGDDPPVAFDGGGPWTRKRILYRLNDRLGHEPGVEYTRFDPGRTAPTGLVASVDPERLLGAGYPAPAATLEVRWSPRSGRKDRFAIQWYERADTASGAAVDERDRTLPEGYTLSCGWHQDDHLNDLGPAHFQEEYPDGSVERYGASFGEVNPVWILSECLANLPDRLRTFRGRLDEEPS